MEKQKFFVRVNSSDVGFSGLSQSFHYEPLLMLQLQEDWLSMFVCVCVCVHGCWVKPEMSAGGSVESAEP